MAKFLDDSGLRALWAKAKELLGGKLDRGGGTYDTGDDFAVVNSTGDTIRLDIDGVSLGGSVGVSPGDDGKVSIGWIDDAKATGIIVPGKNLGVPLMLFGDVSVGGDQYGADLAGSLTVPAPTEGGHAATKKYVDDKVAKAGDMQSSVYDPQGRGEDVFAAIDQKTAYQQAVSAGYTGTEAEFYAALVALKDGPFLPTKGGEILGPLTVDVSGWERGKYAGLNLSNADGAIGLTASDDQLELGVVPWQSDEFGVYLNKGAGEVHTVTPDPKTEKNIANKRYVDTQIQTRAAANHVHTADEVGALPADASDITGINTISGLEDHVMVDMSAGLTISVDGADRIVVEQSEIHVSSPLSMGGNIIKSVKVPSIASDAANKQYVDGQVATRAPVDHTHEVADVGADPSGSAAAVDTKLTAHTGNKSNPHGVTAEQVGARPTAWTPSKADVGLGSVPNVATNDQTPTFTQASARANLASGEKLSVLFGKLMKWFSDLKTVAFTGAYSDLTDKPTSMTPVAHKATHKTGGEDAITPADIGAAAASHGTHVTYSTTAPVMDGAAAVGTAATVARGDHRHPVDTSRSAKSTLVSTTIGTTWDGSVGAWTQTLNIAGVTATNVVEVFLSKEATDTQDEAFTALQLRDGGQAAGSITLKAKGAKNTISIPITVIVRGDL